MNGQQALNVADIVACCFPRTDRAVQLSIFGVVAVYGFAEDKGWAKWLGLAGVAVSAAMIARCVKREIDKLVSQRQAQLTAASSTSAASSSSVTMDADVIEPAPSSN